MPSSSIPITILILTLILILILILIFKPVNKGTGITNFKASLFTAVNGVPIINFSYTNPASFGSNDAKYLHTVFYIVECPDGTCPSTIPQPTIEDLNGQACIKPQGHTPYINNSDMKGQVSVINERITGQMDTSVYFVDTCMIPGKTYMFGISIINDANLFGDFVYAQIGLPDNTPPGPVSVFSANLT